MEGYSLYNNICLIGLGTIGGFLAKNLSEMESIKKLLLIDYDTVEIENIKNSIYTSKDVGKLKTYAIYDKLDNKKRIKVLNEKFIEGKTKIPSFDLILDCRDFTYNRKELIDARLYVSYRSLIIDCRKNVSYEKQHEGKYITRLTKTDLRNASLNVTTLIENGIFKKIVKKGIVYEIPIDIVSEKIQKQLDKNIDVIYDCDNVLEKRLINLNNHYTSILDINKKSDLVVYLGNKNLPYNSTVVPKNNLRSIQDIVQNFTYLTKNLPYQFNYYIITVTNYNNQFYVELLPETGSA
jgi:hypothetical protein